MWYVKIKLLLYPRTKALADGTDFTLTELREYVNKNIGVKIYRDKISVKPYGYSNIQYGGDWLELQKGIHGIQQGLIGKIIVLLPIS